MRINMPQTAPPEWPEPLREVSTPLLLRTITSDHFCAFLEDLIDLFDKAIARQDEHLARARAEADYYASLYGRR